MKSDMDRMIEEIMESLEQTSPADIGDVPDIDLYIDQVTRFMDSRLSDFARDPQKDKILTKTMINNYAKNDLLPAPVKKKYSKEHIVFLILIYYFKNVMSISDLQTVLKPLEEHFFDGKGSVRMMDIYEEIFRQQPMMADAFHSDIVAWKEKAQEMFSDVEGEEKEILSTFSFISMLGFDVFARKLMLERLLDEMRSTSEE